ncbi:MAG: hypothetical protein V3U92_14740 [Cellulophaga sp.]
MHKIVKIILIVLSVVGVVLMTQLPETEVPYAEAVEDTSMGLMFMVTYLLLAIAVIASFAFAIVNLVSSPAKLKKTLFAVGGLLLVTAIAYGLASGTDIDIAAMADKGIETDESTVKKIGMGIKITTILLIVAVASMIIPGVKRTFSK